MRIYITNGYYRFFPDGPMDISLAREKGLDLLPYNGFYTFPALISAPTYSLVGRESAVAQYAGDPVDVMGVNKWVYSLSAKKIVPAGSVGAQADISSDGTRIISIGIPQAGAMIGKSGRLKSCVISWKPENGICVIQGVELWT